MFSNNLHQSLSERRFRTGIAVWVIGWCLMGRAVADDPTVAPSWITPLTTFGPQQPARIDNEVGTGNLQPVSASRNLIDDVRQTRTSESLLSRDRFQPSAANDDGFMLPISVDASYVTGGSYNITSIGLSGMVPVWMDGDRGGDQEPGDMLALQLEMTSTFLDVQTDLDVPGTLYEIQGGLMWNHRINDRWSTMSMIQLGIQSDLQTSKDAFNVSGVGMARWKWKDNVNLSFGVAVTTQDNLPILPAAGIEWRPADDWEIMLGIPETRIAHRLRWYNDISTNPDEGLWVYLAPGLGGGTYGVKRADGRTDRITLQDFPVSIGLERRSEEGPTFTAELGYVFSRKIEYEVSGDKRSFDDGISFRFGMSY